MLIKSFMGGDVYKNNVTPGVYPKWSRMHLRIWCILRVESMVLVPLTSLYRSAPLRAFAIRQLGATGRHKPSVCSRLGTYGPLDLLTIDDDVAIQTGAYIQMTRWSRPVFAGRPYSSRERLQDRHALGHCEQCHGRQRHVGHALYADPERRGFA